MAMKADGDSRRVLITGGAGFVGSNLAARLLEEGARVTVFDNLSRGGVEHNLEWLNSLATRHRLQFVRGDVRSFSQVTEVIRSADEVYHLAAQVAVTTSVEDPRTDFEVNAGGTFNVLEAARKTGRRPMVLFTSTNKVYGALESVAVERGPMAYRAADVKFRGVEESTTLDFHSPYGCSKGTADQYVRDYARIYDLPTVVFRMSCIAGPRQFGNEDQGWVAHFLYSVLGGKTINIYGDGLQVRDILHVYDLVDAMQSAHKSIATIQGEVYNIGGGMERAVSVMEMIGEVERLTKKSARLLYSQVRPGDQPLYVSNNSKLSAHTGWQPCRPLSRILQDIYEFWMRHRKLIHKNGDQARNNNAISDLVKAELISEEVA